MSFNFRQYVISNELRIDQKVKGLSDVQSLPHDIVSDQSITEIYLDGQYVPTVFPQIWQMTQLKTLRLENFNLNSLPSGVLNLVNLEKLSLCNCRFSRFPKEIVKLTNLRELDLSANFIRSIPPTIGYLTNLERLSLTSNRLPVLPDEIGTMLSLSYVNLSSNTMMVEFPAPLLHLKNLSSLNLSGCPIENLPDAIADFPHMTFLNLPLKHIRSLPTRILEGRAKLKHPRENYEVFLKFFHESIKSGHDYNEVAKQARQLAWHLQDRDRKDKTKLFDKSIKFAAKKEVSVYFSVPEVEERLQQKWFGFTGVARDMSWEAKLGYFIDGSKSLKERKFPPIYVFGLHFIVFCVFLGVFSAVAMENVSHKGEQFIHVQEGTNNAFLPGFSDILTIDDYWTYVTTTLLPALYAPTLNRYDLRAGAPLIRQVRVMPNSCKADGDRFEALLNNTLCYYEYKSKYEETDTFTKGGISYYYTEDDSTSAAGSGTAYPRNGGYKIYLHPTDLNNATKTIQTLIDTEWFDIQTRAIIVDFTYYNPNEDMVAVVEMVVEGLPAGSLIPSAKIVVFRLYPYDLAPVIVLGIILVFFMVLEVNEIINEVKAGKNFWKKLKKFIAHFFDIWNALELACYILSIYVVARHITSWSIISHLEYDFATNTVLQNCTDCNSWRELTHVRLDEINALSILFILWWLLLFKFLRIFSIFGILFITLVKMIQQLLLFLSIHVVWTVSFAGALTILYGAVLNDYSSWGTTILTLFRVSFGDINIEDPLNVDRKLGFAMLILYILIALILLLNILIAMLNDAYSFMMRNARDTYRMQKSILIRSYDFSTFSILGDSAEDDDEDAPPQLDRASSFTNSFILDERTSIDIEMVVKNEDK